MTTLEEVTVIRAPIGRCFDLARSVEVHLAGNVHSGEQAVAAGGVTTGLVGLGERVIWRAKHFGVWWTLTSEITEMERPEYFRDVMVQGPFGRMEHEHWFRPSAGRDQGVARRPGGLPHTEMRDVFRFAGPLGVLGRVAEWAFLRRYMRELLRERNEAIRVIAESEAWRRFLP
jgi:ligand-binding SRPBCC domain-containing protein